jgi:hypothetical protein
LLRIRTTNPIVDGIPEAESSLLHSICCIVGRGELCQCLYAAVCQSGQYVSQVLVDGDIQFAAALDDAEDGGDLRASLLAAQMQPVFTLMRRFA